MKERGREVQRMEVRVQVRQVPHMHYICCRELREVGRHGVQQGRQIQGLGRGRSGRRDGVLKQRKDRRVLVFQAQQRPWQRSGQLWMAEIEQVGGVLGERGGKGAMEVHAKCVLVSNLNSSSSRIRDQVQAQKLKDRQDVAKRKPRIRNIGRTVLGNRVRRRSCRNGRRFGT